MPELPEVEVICQGLRPHVEGRRIIGISCGPKELRLAIPRTALQEKICGARITELGRRAKYLLFAMDNGCRFLIHLGMTGRLGIFAPSAPRALHDHLFFRLDDGMEMRYNDTRRFGFVVVQDKDRLTRSVDPLARLGPEPFWTDFSAEYLKEKAGKRLQPVKNFLMDSHVVVGIGNIYANEILFQSGIRPTMPIGSLSVAQWQKIVDKSREVLTQAIKSGGTTISDYRNASGKPGYFQLELAVYGRSGQPCRKCSSILEKQTIAGRATYFCPQCQK
ncbi:MAG: bifunctional DNA-formamidopyrimidine glycosylase/DNA-(apurinic or apyrimidinic site) lyase [Proteobacteria bacterium]|nr:bifunctional DNA-formamidopyrimidine glycosylase/DNA-(apurinic or apyrimidinic site) lyase [Pseudomonadota bacterium]MBU1639177.1 bifunctional DNA-formamidopyrimidine glycosylase/DNA-(apurinic or apyrimidinic site) lyase [Pseudomonadota bacterium]